MMSLLQILTNTIFTRQTLEYSPCFSMTIAFIHRFEHIINSESGYRNCSLLFTSSEKAALISLYIKKI